MERSLERAEDYFARYREIIPDYEGFLESLSEPLPLYFRLNTLKTKDPEPVISGLTRQGFRVEKTEIPWFFRVEPREASLGNTEEYYLGLIYPMTLSSSLPVYALDPQPGELILDLCAAPGSKTTQIAQWTEDRAVIAANDRRLDRITALVANLRRLGVACALTTVYRGEMYPLEVSFDKVLVDAPCSGEGRYRKGYEGELLYQKEGRTNLSGIQKGLLVRAFDLLKPGGILVYSTCTINPEENEAVVDYLLRKRQAELLDWEAPLPARPGLTEWEGRPFHPELVKAKRFFPHEIQAVGFFVAKLRRRI
ncbi:RsmB/NOP family class I SAM-dependent RNA methyltransferase [Thermosulfurimonas marina]|uniref:RsmB/NOP family class I SAM-dependent RNA methyltransferase n=1 Tax=Thermosulfurimonas marina TaxID=2047767 RepID=A0A6H1WUS0_9BACT|nr:RsmB/NOP family class I SAM-dependent RNA methyltransferase [Thermosulfurimonas marina]QJA06899.1 RsmB/NOP family class I SAM-dependent RNA methyltransferase [Thermosulfurimonas marina]